MDLQGLLYVLLIYLGATALCVALFDKLGLGSVVGFIVAGIVIGPHTPGPIATNDVAQLQGIAELGVVLFMFIVGLQLRPRQLWAMRGQLTKLGGGQVLLSAAALTPMLVFGFGNSWPTGVILGLGLAMSSTAVVLTILASRGEMATRHGQSMFATLMAQDILFVLIMALIPLLGVSMAAADQEPIWLEILASVGVLGAILLGGRFVLPMALGWAARTRNREAFGILLFLGVIAAAWVSELAGISMTLGAFLLGVMLSASDYRYQVEAVVEPFKVLMMGLFFVSVGMAIEFDALVSDWQSLVLLVVGVLVIKGLVLGGLCRLLGQDRPTAIRSAFGLAQVGEMAFVIFTTAAAAGLLDAEGKALGFLVISSTMVLTPLLFKAGDRLARALKSAREVEPEAAPEELHNHLVIVGLNNVGRLIALLAEQAEIPYVAFDKEIDEVNRCQRAGRCARFGDIRRGAVQQAASLGRARAVFIATIDKNRVRAIALSLRTDYPQLQIFARTETLREGAYLREHGIHNAGTMYIESTLFRGGQLLKVLGVPEEQAGELIEDMRRDDFRLLKKAFSVAD